jgi:Arc/MetJ-type ribon-helix-helix transcriptional regulator
MLRSRAICETLPTMSETVRTHVILPKDLVAAIDRLVGQRRRSQYVEQAVAEKLRRDRQGQTLADVLAHGPLIDPAAHPEWATPEQTAAWISDLRAEADANAQQKRARAGRP